MPIIPVAELRDGKSESRPTLRDQDTYVVSLCSGAFVRVPPWFSVGGALELARHRNARFVLVEDRGSIGAIADDRQLAAAPSTSIVCREASPVGPRLGPEVTWRQALSVMRQGGHRLLLVGNERTIAGVVTFEALERFERRR